MDQWGGATTYLYGYVYMYMYMFIYIGPKLWPIFNQLWLPAGDKLAALGHFLCWFPRHEVNLLNRKASFG